MGVELLPVCVSRASDAATKQNEIAFVVLPTIVNVEHVLATELLKFTDFVGELAS